MSAPLDGIARYLDGWLRVAEIEDWPQALNGLQVANGGVVSCVGAAVDASEASIAAAAEAGCDLLLVHHGLFWDGNRPVTGRRYRRLKRLFDAGMALYSSHLPLDAHPEVGNNALLARALGIEPDGGLGERKGVAIGVRGALSPVHRDELRLRIEAAVGGPVQLIAGGPETVRRAGVITGAGGSEAGEAIAAGLDALITGEGAHHTYFDAVEGGLNLYYAGHYATETFGVRALARHVGDRFGLPWHFFDLPTGL